MQKKTFKHEVSIVRLQRDTAQQFKKLIILSYFHSTLKHTPSVVGYSDVIWFANVDYTGSNISLNVGDYMKLVVRNFKYL